VFSFPSRTKAKKRVEIDKNGLKTEGKNGLMLNI